MKRIISLVVIMMFAGCGKLSDKDKIGNAQSCIDKSTKDNVSLCVEMVSGLEGQSANLIRCSAGFIKQGFSDSDKLVSAFSQLSEGGQDAMLEVMAFSGDNATQEASDTYNYCSNAGAPGLAMMASMVQIATSLKALTTNCTQSCIEQGVTCLLNPGTAGCEDSVAATASQEAIGGAAILAYQQNCGANSSGNEELCANLSAAGAGGANPDPSAIGEQFACVVNPSAAGCN